MDANNPISLEYAEQLGNAIATRIVERLPTFTGAERAILRIAAETLMHDARDGSGPFMALLRSGDVGDALDLVYHRGLPCAYVSAFVSCENKHVPSSLTLTVFVVRNNVNLAAVEIHLNERDRVWNGRGDAACLAAAAMTFQRHAQR